MRKRQAVAAVTAIILGVTGCSGNTRTAATTAQTTAAQETTVSGETTAAQETTAAEPETDSQDSAQAGTAVNPEIYTGLTEEEVSQIEASMEEILANNPFGLVYNGAITENVEGEVNIRPVSYQNQQGIDLAANLYLPAGYDENGSYAAIVVAHPNGGVKEQVSGLFAPSALRKTAILPLPLTRLTKAPAAAFPVRRTVPPTGWRISARQSIT